MIKTQKEFVLSSLQRRTSFLLRVGVACYIPILAPKFSPLRDRKGPTTPPPRPRRPTPSLSTPCFRPPGPIARKNYPRLSVGFLLSPSRIKLAHCSPLTSVGATVKRGRGGAEPDAHRQAPSPLPIRTTCALRGHSLPTAQLTRGPTLTLLSFPTTPTARCSVTSPLSPHPGTI